MNDQEVFDLNSCPCKHFLLTRAITYFCTLEEFGAIDGLFNAFDRSKYSSIQDASLVLNSQMADACAMELCSDSCLLSVSIALDNDIEHDLISSEMGKGDLKDLKLLPDGLLQEKWSTSSFSTREKSETVTARGVPTFDGSMFTPIEEVSFILNAPLANVCVSVAHEESEITSENVENEANEVSDKPGPSTTWQPNPLTRDLFKHMVLWDRNIKLKCHERGLPSSRKRKNDIVARQVNSEAYRIRSPCFADNSRLIKGKASNYPLKHTLNWKIGAIKSVLDKEKNHQIKQIDEGNCNSDPSLLCNSSFQDDDLECAIINSEMSEREMIDFNLLPNGLLPQYWVTTSSRSKKNPTVVTGGFHVFDGSRYNPIEEASLILNRPIACLNVNIGAREEIKYEGIHLFKNLQAKEVSGNVSRELPNENANALLSFQVHPTRYGDPQAQDIKDTSKECTSNDNWTLEKSFNSVSCIGSNSFEVLPIQNNQGDQPGRIHYLSQHQACDSIVSADLTPKFQEQDIGLREIEMHLGSFEDEVDKIVDGSAPQPCQYLCCDSLVNMVQCDYNGEGNSILSFKQPLMQLGKFIDRSEQEPLSRPFTPDCLLHGEKKMESSLHKIDSDYECADPARECKGKYRKGRLPGPRKTKTAMLLSEVNSEGYGLKLPCLAEKSKPVKIRASKIPLTNLSQSKRNSARSITSKTRQKRVKETSKVGFCSNRSSVTDLSVIDNDPEHDLIKFEISEKELLDLNLLPNGFLPEKSISPVSTTKKSEPVPTGGFCSFDGSRFSPIEEASLLLNISTTDVFVGVADVETDTSSENINLFKHLGSWKMSDNIFAETFQTQDDIVDPMLESQLHSTQFCDFLVEEKPIALAKQPSQCPNLGFFDQMVYCDYNEQRNSKCTLDYNSQNV